MNKMPEAHWKIHGSYPWYANIIFRYFLTKDSSQNFAMWRVGWNIYSPESMSDQDNTFEEVVSLNPNQPVDWSVYPDPITDSELFSDGCLVPMGYIFEQDTKMDMEFLEKLPAEGISSKSEIVAFFMENGVDLNNLGEFFEPDEDGHIEVFWMSKAIVECATRDFQLVDVTGTRWAMSQSAYGFDEWSFLLTLVSENGSEVKISIPEDEIDSDFEGLTKIITKFSANEVLHTGESDGIGFSQNGYVTVLNIQELNDSGEIDELWEMSAS